MPVLLGVLLALNAGLWSAVIVIGAGNLLFNVLVLRGMARSTGYRADISGFGRVLLAGVVGYLCGMLAPESGSSLTDLLLQGSMVLAGYLPAVLVFGALTAEDRMHLASALRHWRRS